MSEHFRRFEQSNRLQQRSRRSIPGGSHTYAKGEDQYPVLAPGFVERGSGCHVWEVDGNRFVDGVERLLVGRPSQPVYRHTREPAEVRPIAANRRRKRTPRGVEKEPLSERGVQ